MSTQTQQHQQRPLTDAYKDILQTVERRADGSHPVDYRTAAEAIIDTEVRERGYQFLTAIITLSSGLPDPEHWDKVGFDESTPGGALRCLAVACIVDDVLNRL